MAHLTRWLSRPQPRTSPRPSLRVETLESRDVPATFMVSNTADSGAGSLRDAIAQANDEATNPGADTIRFNAGVFGNTINLSTVGDTTFGPSALAITSDITIDGLTGYTSGAGVTIARDGAVSNLRLFVVSSAGSLTLQGVTLSGGAAIGGDGTTGSGGGGGGAGMGGAIFNQGTLAIVQSTLTNNAATGGNGGNGTGDTGGGGAGGGPNGGAAGTSTGAGGTGGYGGGGGGGGGGIAFGGVGGNGGFGGGGGSRGAFGAGIGGSGVAGYGGGGPGSHFAAAGGGGAGMGGAIFNHSGTVTITNSTFTNNSAVGGTGGIVTGYPVAPSGEALGGGVFNLNGTATITNSTLSGNAGGALYVLSHGNSGGVGNANAASATLVNTILANSTSGNDLVINQLGGSGGATVTASSPNIVETATNTGGTYTSSGVITSDPVLGALASNGGPTQTMAINALSPGHNVGSNAGAASLTTDQRGTGFARVDGPNVDIGAYEGDGVAPTVSSHTWPANATYVAGQNLDFTITYSEAVNVTGTPRIPLTIGSTGVFANYFSGSGTTSITFRYTVQAGDLDTDGILVSVLQLNGGTIRDAAFNNANSTFSYPSTAGVRVDAVPPTISSVTGPANATYVAGQNLDFTVNFSENVTVNTGGGTPTIQLTIGSTNVNASYVSGTGTSALVFRYTVVSGDLDTNGIASASPIVLNGGTIQDAATNNAVLTFTPPTTTGVLVDAVAPAVTSVAVPANGSYRAGQNLTFTVNFSEAVTVTGTPQLALTIGATVVQANYLSGSPGTALVFQYTVLAGQNDTDGITVGTLTLNGGTIQDAATNNANLTLNGVGSTAAVLVDTTAPTAPIVTAPASAVTVNAATFAVTGTAEANALVEIYSDLNNNGAIDGADALVGSQQLTGGATSFSITVTLTQDAVNDFTARATDAAGNTSPLADVPRITEDSTAATVTTVTPPANGAYMAGTNLDFVLTYSELVTVTGAPRIALTVGGASVFATYLSGTGSTALTFRYTVQPGDTDTDGVALGTSIDLNGGTIRDAGSNDASVAVPSTPTPNVIVDTTAPTVAMTSATPAATNANPIPVTVTFSEVVTGFDITDLTAINGTVSNFVAVSGSTYTFDLIPTTDGAVSVDIVSFSGAIDAAGNPADPAATFTRTYDGTRPTTTVALASGQAAFTALNTARFAVTFSEDVTGFDPSDVIVGGTATGGSVTVTGSGSSYIVTVSGLTRDGTVNVTIADAAGTDAVGNTSVVSSVSPDVTYRTVPTIIPVSTPGGAGGTQIQIFDPETNTVIRTVTPFPGYGGAIDMASIDMNGDGVDDFIVGAGAGGAPHVKVIDGANGNVLWSFFAFTTAFTGGVDVAAGDVTGDGVPDIVVGAGPNAAAHVKVFDGATRAEERSFFAYTLAYRYGVNVAVGDTNGDGYADIVTAPTMFGAPHVQVFSGYNNALLQSFFAYNVAFTGGVTVAVGDTNGDGFADIITGTGLGGVPHVKVFNGNTRTERASFFAYTTLFAGGVDVAAADVNGDGLADIVTGAGPGAGPHVKAFDGNTLREIESFFAANIGFLGGVNVG